MTTLKKSVLVAVLATFAAILGGCSTNSPKQSSIPWSQPAAWEAQIPGMSAPMGR
jgi:hypothetical protein